MSIEIAEFLHACGEPEMAEAVENMHNRLEAFASGLDQDCIEAAGRAVEELTKQRADLLTICEELQESAEYWSEYFVPLGIVERLDAAIARAKGGAA